MDLHIFLEVIRSLQVIQQVLRLENSTVQRNLGFTDRTTCRICMSFFRNITCDNSQRASLPSWPKKICVRPLYKPHQTVLSPGCKQTLVLLSLPSCRGHPPARIFQAAKRNLLSLPKLDRLCLFSKNMKFTKNDAILLMFIK